MDSDLEKLIVLHELDLMIQQCQTNIKGLEIKCKHIEEQLQILSIDYNEVKGYFKHDHKDQHKRIKELESLHNNGKQMSTILLAINNKLLYPIALSEIDSLRKKVVDFETEMLKKRDDLNSIKKQEKDISEQLNIFLIRRQATTKDLPEVLFKIYERIKSNKNTALAEIINNCCQGCYTMLSCIMVKRVREGKLITRCENCGRIVYRKIEDIA